MGIQLHPSLHIPAGVWLKEEIVEPYGVTIKDLALHFGVSRQNLSNVLNGRTALTADMAIRFEQAFGIKADTMMRMQAAYEVAQVRLREEQIKVERLTLARPIAEAA